MTGLFNSMLFSKPVLRYTNILCILLLNDIPLYAYATFFIRINILVGILHCFHYLVNVNNAINIYAEDFVWIYDFIILKCIPKSDNTELYNNNCVLNIVMNCKTIFQSNCIILYFSYEGSSFFKSLPPLVVICLRL